MKNGKQNRSGLNNVRETWEQNEREAGAGRDLRATEGTEPYQQDELQQKIKDEAAEYDDADKESRILGGDRATLSDDEE